jgi:hypothetical protein
MLKVTKKKTRTVIKCPLFYPSKLISGPARFNFLGGSFFSYDRGVGGK